MHTKQFGNVGDALPESCGVHEGFYVEARGKDGGKRSPQAKKRGREPFLMLKAFLF